MIMKIEAHIVCGFCIHLRNLADSTGSVRISELGMKRDGLFVTVHIPLDPMGVALVSVG